MSNSNEKESLSLSEAARILGLSYGTIYRKVREGTLPAMRIRGKTKITWRIPRDTVAAMLQEGLPHG